MNVSQFPIARAKPGIMYEGSTKRVIKKDFGEIKNSDEKKIQCVSINA